MGFTAVCIQSRFLHLPNGNGIISYRDRHSSREREKESKVNLSRKTTLWRKWRKWMSFHITQNQTSTRTLLGMWCVPFHEKNKMPHKDKGGIENLKENGWKKRERCDPWSAGVSIVISLSPHSHFVSSVSFFCEIKSSLSPLLELEWEKEKEFNFHLFLLPPILLFYILNLAFKSESERQSKDTRTHAQVPHFLTARLIASCIRLHIHK